MTMDEAEMLHLKHRLTINQCHLNDIRDARKAGWASKAELDEEEMYTLRERCDILNEMRKP